MDLRPFTRNAGPNAVALGISLAFGLTARWFAGASSSPALNRVFGQAFPVMMVAFLFGVPFAMGYLAVTARFQIQRESEAPQPGIAYWIFFPWLPAVAAALLAVLFVWEGAICLLFASPVLLLMASIGGITAGLAQRRQYRPAHSPRLLCCHYSSFCWKFISPIR
jgi:hypothetical protein